MLLTCTKKFILMAAMAFPVLLSGGKLGAAALPEADTCNADRMEYRIHYRINSSRIDTSFMGNAAELSRLRMDMDSIGKVRYAAVDSVVIVSSSSVDGREIVNMKLSGKRGLSLQRMIEGLCPELGTSRFVQVPIGEDWKEFRRVAVSDTAIPERERLLEIVDSDLAPDEKERKIRGMKETFAYLLEHHLSGMRFSVLTLHVTAPEPEAEISEVSRTVPGQRIQGMSETSPSPMVYRSLALGGEASGEKGRCRMPMFNVKTNMLYDVVGFPSLEVEIPIGQRWSFNMEGAVAWWSSDRKHTFYQLDMLSPEARWWFGQKSRWHGHYIGVFGMVGLYDLEWKGSTGYKGEYWGVGVSYGYMFPISKHLSLETGLGLGYMRTGYEEYLPMDGHYVYQQSGLTQFFGPLKLKVGLVWRIGDSTPFVKKKGGR